MSSRTRCPFAPRGTAIVADGRTAVVAELEGEGLVRRLRRPAGVVMPLRQQVPLQRGTRIFGGTRPLDVSTSKPCAEASQRPIRLKSRAGPQTSRSSKRGMGAGDVSRPRSMGGDGVISTWEKAASRGKAPPEHMYGAPGSRLPAPACSGVRLMPFFPGSVLPSFS